MRRSAPGERRSWRRRRDDGRATAVRRCRDRVADRLGRPARRRRPPWPACWTSRAGQPGAVDDLVGLVDGGEQRRPATPVRGSGSAALDQDRRPARAVPRPRAVSPTAGQRVRGNSAEHAGSPRARGCRARPGGSTSRSCSPLPSRLDEVLRRALLRRDLGPGPRRSTGSSAGGAAGERPHLGGAHMPVAVPTRPAPASASSSQHGAAQQRSQVEARWARARSRRRAAAAAGPRRSASPWP